MPLPFGILTLILVPTMLYRESYGIQRFRQGMIIRLRGRLGLNKDMSLIIMESLDLAPITSVAQQEEGFAMFTNSISGYTHNRDNSLVRLMAFLFALQFMFLITMCHAEDKNLIADKDYLISLSKKIQNENKMNLDLDNMGVKIYREDDYIVVHFFHKYRPGWVRAGGGAAFLLHKEGKWRLSVH